MDRSSILRASTNHNQAGGPACARLPFCFAGGMTRMSGISAQPVRLNGRPMPSGGFTCEYEILISHRQPVCLGARMLQVSFRLRMARSGCGTLAPKVPLCP